jgi:RNA recognition motif-containing protein
MDEEFLKQAFSQCGEKVSYVRIYANRVTTDHGNVGFAFIGFKDEATAQRVLDKLKGTPIPNTVVMFLIPSSF